MSRSNKKTHKIEIQVAKEMTRKGDSWKTQPTSGAMFHSPGEIRKRGGRVRMNLAEYVAFKMGRGQMHPGRINSAIESRQRELSKHRRTKPQRAC